MPAPPHRSVHRPRRAVALALDIKTITATRLLPLFAASTELPRGPYCPNSVITLHDGALSGYSNYELFDAPDPASSLALPLAFWDLRRPADAPNASTAPDEDVVSVPQNDSTGGKSTDRNRKSKRGGAGRARRRDLSIFLDCVIGFIIVVLALLARRG